MSALPSRQNFADCHPLSAPPMQPTGSRRTGVLRRIYDAVMHGRQHHADRDIARYLDQSGGHLTDEIERRITEHLMRNHSFRL